MESSHGEIASIQQIVRILVFTSDRASGVAAKQQEVFNDGVKVELHNVV